MKLFWRFLTVVKYAESLKNLCFNVDFLAEKFHFYATQVPYILQPTSSYLVCVFWILKLFWPFITAVMYAESSPLSNQLLAWSVSITGSKAASQVVREEGQVHDGSEEDQAVWRWVWPQRVCRGGTGDVYWLPQGTSRVSGIHRAVYVYQIEVEREKFIMVKICKKSGNYYIFWLLPFVTLK